MMFDCGVALLQNMGSSNKIFMVLGQWISRSTGHQSIVITEKVNYGEKRLKIPASNDSSNES